MEPIFSPAVCHMNINMAPWQQDKGNVSPYIVNFSAWKGWRPPSVDFVFLSTLKSNSFLVPSIFPVEGAAQRRSRTWSWVQKACPRATGGELLVQVEGGIDVQRGLLNGNIHQPVRTEKRISHYSTVLHCNSLQGNVWRDAATHRVRPSIGFLSATQVMSYTILFFSDFSL